MPKRTRRFNGYIYDLRTSRVTKEKADGICEAVRSSGKKARKVKISRGNYAVYVR